MISTAKMIRRMIATVKILLRSQLNAKLFFRFQKLSFKTTEISHLLEEIWRLDVTATIITMLIIAVIPVVDII